MSDLIEFRAAIRDALDEELARDERVFFFGEDVATAGGVFAVTPGLHDTHGARVFDTPISELAMMGVAYGSAVAGMRPVMEIMFGDFLPLVMDGLVNQAAKFWYVSNQQASVPLVIRSAVGGGGRFGAIHSQMPAPWFHNIPGLKIVAPSTPGDAKALLKASIRDDNPVLFLEHKRLYSTKGPPSRESVLPLGRAAVVRPGSDLTIVAAMRGVHDALEAAETLAGDGIDAEVIDARTLRPLDVGTIARSVAKTNRLLVLDESPRTGGWGAEVLATIDRARARRPRRRLAHRDAGPADPVQPAARGRPLPVGGVDRPSGARAALTRALADAPDGAGQPDASDAPDAALAVHAADAADAARAADVGQAADDAGRADDADAERDARAADHRRGAADGDAGEHARGADDARGADHAGRSDHPGRADDPRRAGHAGRADDP